MTGAASLPAMGRSFGGEAREAAGAQSKAAQDKTAQDKAAQDRAAQDRAAQDKAAQDKEARSEAAPGQASQDQAGAKAGSQGLRRSRLYLKDGSYQVVLSYRIRGKNLYYSSAERGGEEEMIPLQLIDLDATHRWEQRRDAEASGRPAVEIDPELAREEAEKAARSPEVAENLRLPDGENVVVLDTFQGQPQIAVLQQTDGTLNRQMGHNILRAAINPLSTSHQLVEIPGERASVQLHVDDPQIFIRLDDDPAPMEEVPAGALEVDTHGAKEPKREHTSAKSEYVIVRVEVRRGVRVVTSFSINMLGSSKRQADAIATTVAPMPGGHWLKITPREPLTFGEYALMEVLDERDVNLGVWDFGVHPTAGANRDAILPEERRQPVLEHHRAQPDPE